MQSRKLVAEFLGTFLLVLLAVGAAVSGIAGSVGAGEPKGPGSGIVGVALAFGFVLVFVAFAFGPVSGAHVNPAVTLAMVVARKQPIGEAVGYWIAQILGAVFGAFFLWLFVNNLGVKDQTGSLGTNGYGTSISMGGAFLLEVLLTFAFVLVILLVTDRAANATTAGLGIGVALVVVHLVGIPLTGTSVNPARSIGPALFEGGTALSQLWLFILAPLVGGLIAAVVYPLTRSGEVREEIGQADEA
jgi:aquaporin Z